MVWEPPLAAEGLENFSLKLPFRHVSICQDLRKDTGYSCKRCNCRKRTSILGLISEKLNVCSFIPRYAGLAFRRLDRLLPLGLHAEGGPVLRLLTYAKLHLLLRLRVSLGRGPRGPQCFMHGASFQGKSK